MGQELDEDENNSASCSSARWLVPAMLTSKFLTIEQQGRHAQPEMDTVYNTTNIIKNYIRNNRRVKIPHCCTLHKLCFHSNHHGLELHQQYDCSC